MVAYCPEVQTVEPGKPVFPKTTYASRDFSIDEKLKQLLITKFKNANMSLAHSFTVYDLASIYSNDQQVQRAALLHDILEDTDCTYDDIAVIDKVTADNVLQLTRGKETYKEYIDRIINSNNVVYQVKLLDLLDHLANYKTLKKSLLKRYLKAIEELLNRGE